MWIQNYSRTDGATFLIFLVICFQIICSDTDVLQWHNKIRTSQELFCRTQITEIIVHRQRARCAESQNFKKISKRRTQSEKPLKLKPLQSLSIPGSRWVPVTLEFLWEHPKLLCSTRHLSGQTVQDTNIFAFINDINNLMIKILSWL